MAALNRTSFSSSRLPKVIDPKTHAVLDYVTTAYFLITAGMFWGRHRRAAATALVNGLSVLGLSLITDYPGGAVPLISFDRGHRTGDIIQAAMAAGMPTLLGFGDKKQALPFRLQALNEVAVVGLTDWEGQKVRGRFSRAA